MKDRSITQTPLNLFAGKLYTPLHELDNSITFDDVRIYLFAKKTLPTLSVMPERNLKKKAPLLGFTCVALTVLIEYCVLQHIPVLQNFFTHHYFLLSLFMLVTSTSLSKCIEKLYLKRVNTQRAKIHKVATLQKIDQLLNNESIQPILPKGFDFNTIETPHWVR